MNLSLSQYTEALETYINETDDYVAPSHSWITVEALAAYGHGLHLEVTDLEDWEGYAEEAYSGQYADDAIFARETADSLGAVPDNAPWPLSCIDWEQAASDLMADYFENGGYYFRNL